MAKPTDPNTRRINRNRRDKDEIPPSLSNGGRETDSGCGRLTTVLFMEIPKSAAITVTFHRGSTFYWEAIMKATHFFLVSGVSSYYCIIMTLAVNQ